VRKILVDCALAHPKVLSDPAPDVKFLKFGDSSLDLSFRFRVPRLSDSFGTECDVREAVYNALNKNNIEIPFPQQSVWIEKMPENSQLDKIAS